MKLRFAMPIAVAATAALTLTACGTDEPAASGYKPSVPPPTATSAPATTAAPQKVAPATHLNRVTFVPAMNTAITKQKSWRIEGTMTAGGTTMMTMDGVQTAKPLAMKMEMSGQAFEGKTAKFVLVDDTAYASIPGMTPSGKYVKIDAADAPEIAELLEGGDPTKIYKSFEGALRNVRFVGSEPGRREMLDRYEITVDTAKALAAQGKKVPAGVPPTLKYTIWMDKHDLVRKLEFNLSGVSMVMTMSDYNKSVSIKAPPANKIVR